MPTWTAMISEERLETGDWRLAQRRLEARDWRPVPYPLSSSQPQASSLKSLISSLKPQVSSLRGFTLLELSLVLFIIGLLVTVIIPRLGDLSGTRLESSARRLAALARYLNGEAAFRSQLYRLNYDLAKRAYWVSVLVANQNAPEFIIDTSLLSRPVQLPPSITFVDIHVPGAGRVSTGQVYTHFYPQGYTDPTTIHLRDQHSRVVTVTIPPLPAEVGVSEGYVDGFVSR
jgi:prepilin-type N-terminal cleavage/methylation domain-containing protein